MKVTRIFDLLPHYLENYPEQKAALACKRSGQWRKYSIHEYVELVDLISYGLMQLDLEPGANIGIVSKNRPEWNMLDMAIMQSGYVSIPIYPTISQEDYKHILNHSEMKIVFVDGQEILSKIRPLLPEFTKLKELILIDKDSDLFRNLNDLIETGRQNPLPEKLAEIRSSIHTSDLATIIYTSGTTGNPKGVMLSHSNLVHQIYNLYMTPAKWSKTALSFLPLCHAYERMMVYLYQYLGMSVYYAESIEMIGANIKEIKPTMMTCVPRLLEKIYDKLYLAGLEQKGVKKIIYFWAFRTATKYKIEYMRPWLRLKLKIADKLIYSKWRAAIGGNFDIVVSGGSALQSHMASFFSAIGMPVFEGYGMSEASPVIAVSQRVPNGRKFGTVGLPLPGVEIKLGENGEILCKGHNVMMGYYRDPELTKNVIDKDGWLHTGDTGKFTKLGQLIITGRLKSIFKTSYGKYVNPQLIESKFTESPLLENMLVVGENKPYVVAIISPDFAYLATWCKKHGIQPGNNQKMLDLPLVQNLFEKTIRKNNAAFSKHEQIKKWHIVPEQWTAETGQLSPTLKIKRNVLEEQYNKELADLYE
jgi:long-chain acyl-CoA synthetase